jgi:hypothetical protein
MDLFWGAFLGIIVIVAIAIIVIVIKFRRLCQRNESVRILAGFAKGIASGELDFEVPEEPKSLNRCDSLLIPQIERDLPDFDPERAKNIFRNYVKKHYASAPDFTIYTLCFARYLRASLHKTIIMQAACSYTRGGKRVQIRVEADYIYSVHTDDETIASNCPNCGGAIGYGMVNCPYCGSHVSNVMSNTWEFKNIRET